MGQKNPKGSVAIKKEAGRIRLRWRYRGIRYSLNLFAFSKNNLLQAKKVAVDIEQDMIVGRFDSTLKRYKGISESNANPQVTHTLVELFQIWVHDYMNRDCNQHKNYNTVRAMLLRWRQFKPDEVATKLNLEKINITSYNRRLSMLKSFMTWLVKYGHISTNPLVDVQPKKGQKVVNSKRLPFTIIEILQILDAFKNDTFSAKSSPYKHSHYYPFMYFMFATGVRNAEAIALRVKHLNFLEGHIEIKEAYARTLHGTHSAVRIRKETKNGKERKIPMSQQLAEVLESLVINKKEDDLVFLSPKGLAIDDKMFQRRVFKKVLKSLEIKDRDLYACRHTFGSRCISEGLTPVMTAFLMGNSAQTALRSYTHLIELPKTLPGLG